MISQRSMSRFTVRSGLINQASRIFGPRSESRPLSQLSESHNLSSDLENLSGQTPLLNKSAPRFLGNLGMKFGFPKVNDSVSPPSALSFRSCIHSSCPKEIETDQTSSSFNFTRGIFDENEGDNSNNTWIRRDNSMRNNGRYNNTDQTSRSFNFMRALLDENGRDDSNNMWNRRANSMWNNGRDNNTWNGRDNNKVWVSRSPGYNTERDADIVHVKLIRNNAFVTVTDSKGNKKIGASSGCLAEMKGGPKVSRYAAEATAEHVGRLARNMGLKSFVIKVNGFTYFKKKKQAILSFREGYTHSRSDQNPIMYIEDTTRKAHNGCRLRKQRRV